MSVNQIRIRLSASMLFIALLLILTLPAITYGEDTPFESMRVEWKNQFSKADNITIRNLIEPAFMDVIKKLEGMKKEIVIAEYENIRRKETPNKRPGDIFESILTEAIFAAALKSYSKEEIIQLCSRGMPVFINGEHVMEYMFRHHDDALGILTGLFMKTTDETEKTGFRDMFLTRLFPTKFEYKNDEQLCEKLLSYYLANKEKLVIDAMYSRRFTAIRRDKNMDDVTLFILK